MPILEIACNIIKNICIKLNVCAYQTPTSLNFKVTQMGYKMFSNHSIITGKK